MRAERLLSIMLRLQDRKKVTARELSAELQVSVRTIYRDMDTLSLAGVPIYTQRGEDGGCFLDEAYRVSLTNLNLTELQALFVMGGSSSLEALNINHRVEDGLLKLLASLPSSYQAQAKALRQRLYIDTRRWNQFEDGVPLLQVIESAVWQDKIIDVVYQSFNKPIRKIRIMPYGLVVKTHIWYVIGFAEGQTDFRVYRVSRFEDVIVTDEHFERDPDFDLKTVWDSLRENFETTIKASYTVMFSLSSEMVGILDYYIPNRYHIVGEEGDIATIEAQFYNINEARPVLLGFGNRATIISPRELDEQILEYAKSIVAQHDD